MISIFLLLAELQNMISKEQIFQLSKEVLSQEIDGESILLDIKSENYFGLNDVGSRVIEILQSGNNINNVTVILLEEFNVGRERSEERRVGKECRL